MAKLRLPSRPFRPITIATCVAVGFAAIVAVRSHRASPEARLPRRNQLAALIERQRGTTTRLQRQVEGLRRQVEQLRSASASHQADAAGESTRLQQAGTAAGLGALEGPGIKVTLDDSAVEHPPTSATVNDLVIHSQDVQAVVNALWLAGTEAMAVNEQRVVSTSAVLCVGNTLLINGSVFSPPYEVAAIGASKDLFESDRLVRRLHTDADTFGLRFSVNSEDRLRVPAYAGALSPHVAKPQ